MKNILYILFSFALLYGCSNGAKKSHKEELIPETKKDAGSAQVMESDSIEIFGTEIQESNAKLSFQKIAQIIEIAVLSENKDIAKEIRDNSLKLAKSLYKDKSLQLIKEELAALNLPKCDSVRVSNFKGSTPQTTNVFTQQINFVFDIYTYNNGIESKIKGKHASLEFKNNKTKIEGKTYYSISSKILKID